MRLIDTHEHIWDPSRGEYSWLSPGDPLRRSFTMDELEPQLHAAGVTGCILVQAANTTDDSARMLEAARERASVLGVVAWVALDEPGRVAAAIDALRAAGPVIGTRDLIHTRADARWILRDDVADGLDRVAETGLPFDVVTADDRGLELVPELAARHPSLRIVVDHLGKPPIGGSDADRQRWRRRLAACAEAPTVAAKLSGLSPAAGAPDAWDADDLRPFVDAAIEVLGPDRLMLGGDWPICVGAGGYSVVWHALRASISGLDPVARARIHAGTAIEWYRLDDHDLDPQPTEQEP